MKINLIPEETFLGSESALEGGGWVWGRLLCGVTCGIQAGYGRNGQSSNDDAEAEFEGNLWHVNPKAMNRMQNHLHTDERQDECKATR